MQFSLLIAHSVTVTREYYYDWSDNWNSGFRADIQKRIWDALPLKGKYHDLLFVRDDYNKHSSYHAVRGASLLWDNGVKPSNSGTGAPNGHVDIRVPTKAIITKKEFWALRRSGKIVLSDYDRVKSSWFFEPRLRVNEKPNPHNATSRTVSSSTVGIMINYPKDYGLTWYRKSSMPVQYQVNYREYLVEWLTEEQYTVPAFLHAPLMDSKALPIDTVLVTDVAADAEAGVLDALTNLAELPETIKYLVSLATQVAEASKACKRREVEIHKLAKRKAWTAVQLTKALASVWLQYRYAIMPLLLSIADIQNVLDSYRRIFAEYKDWFEKDFEMPDVPGLTFNGMAVITHRCFIKRSYSAEDVLSQLNGVLKMNPITTGIELITLSFTWEWLVNLGSFLTALTGSKTYMEQGAQYSWRLSYSGTYQNERGEIIFSVRGDEYYRRVISPSAHIGLRFRLDMNWMRTLDAIALASGPFLKSIKRL